MNWILLFLFAQIFPSKYLLEEKKNTDHIFQVSTLDALKEGQYDGQVTFKDLSHYGDFGLGTFDHLDGEMVALDGQFFQIKADGKAYPAKMKENTPFAEVTHFEADYYEKITQQLNFQELLTHIKTILPDTLSYFGLKIQGKFNHIQTRSVFPQQKPYPPLSEAIANQVTFNLENIQGTMVGYYMPDEAEGIGAPGFHFHFISEDRTTGGHVLNLAASQLNVSIDFSKKLKLLRGKK